MADDQPVETEVIEAPEVETPAEETIAEEESQPESTPPSQPEEYPQEEEQPQAAVEEEVANEDPPQMSRRKAKRLEKLEGLIERLKTPEQQAQAPSAGIDYREMMEADPELIEQLETKSQQYGQAQYNAGLEQAKAIQFHTRLEIDAPRVESKYPQFDPSSPDFNPSATSAINEWYLATVGYDPQTDRVANPNVRYAEFVEGVMELADNMAGVKTQQATRNIAQQAAKTGLRPDGTSVKPLDLNKAPEDMTDEELRAATNATMPRDSRGRFLSTK